MKNQISGTLGKTIKLLTLKRSVQISFIIAVLCVMMAASSKAQLGVYAFTGAASCPTPNVSVTAQPANATFTVYRSVGTTCSALANAFRTQGWNTTTTIDLNEYNEFTVTPNAGFLLTLTSFSFTHLVSQNASSGNTTWYLRSSLDNYAANLGTGTATTNSQTPTVNLPAGFNNIGAVTFRLYLVNTRLSTITWQHDNVTLNGSVVTVTPGNPTSNSPQCATPGVTLTRTGTVPAGQTWYWQTTATGTSTTNSAASYTATTSGTYYIRARSNTSSIWSTGAGSLAVVITPNVGATTFTGGSASTRCQGAALVDYTANAANATAITYTLDATSSGAGNSINSLTGDITYTAAWAGTSTITATATGCGTATTATHTITTTPYVTTPAFTLGAASARCQGAGTVTYTATASNTTGITYSLDAASVTGGNAVNASGVVTYSANWTGTTTITANAAGCSGPKTATHTVTINPTIGVPVFASGSTSGRCQGAETVSYPASALNTTNITYTLDAGSLTGGNTINASTGDVIFVAGWAGTSTVTASAAGCGGPKTATHVITTTATVATPTFTLGATSTRCQAAGTITYAATANYSTGITYSLDAASSLAGNSINPATGAVTYIASWTNNTIITATATGCNGPTTSSHTVTTNLASITPVFESGATSTRCQGTGTINYSATATAGITYSLDGASLTGGNTINPSTGDVIFAASWSGTTVITASAAGCSGAKTATHTVSVTSTVGTPVFTLGATSNRCQQAGIVSYIASASASTGITYSLDVTSLAGGNTIDVNTGDVTYAAGWFGTSVITVNATGCNGPSTASHTVTTNEPVTAPVFSLGSATTICQNAGSITYTATANHTTGITYTLDALSISGGNSINAATGVVDYAAGWSGTSVITASAAGCFGPLTSTHTVTVTATVGVPVFAIGSTSNRCQAGETQTYSATATTNTGITYSLDAASLSTGNTIDPATGEVHFSNSWVGTSVVTASATGCNGPVSATHTIITSGPVTVPVFSGGSSTIRCQGAVTVPYTASSDYTTGITYSLDAVSIAGGNSINASTGDVLYSAGWSGTTQITATVAGCLGPQSAVHTATITPTVGVPVFSTGTASTRCQGAGQVTYTSTSTTNTGITYSLDGASITGGNSINALTGEVTYVTGWSGTTIITASATGCSGPRSATHTVTVTPTVGTPVFLLGAASTHCQDLATNTYTYSASATNNTGISYTLDALSLDGGNSVNATTGVITFVSTWAGSSVITATSTGCNGPSTASHTITITPSVGAPLFDRGATSVRCQGSATEVYASTSTTNTGITYTLDVTSRNAGNTINAATGAVTFTSAWFGTSTVTARATGCNGPKNTNHVITTTATVGVPVFAMGANSSRCNGAGTVTYSATATTTTGITYSLDATSLTAGNTIDPLTGAVSFVESWKGTTASVITATAEGCNGPKTATHTVITNGSVTVPVFAIGATSVRCQGAGGVDYIAYSTNNTGITYTLDLTSRNAGNTINASSGRVTYVSGWSGTSVITATATGCYGPQSDFHTVTVTPTVGIPVFSMGSTSTRCQGAEVIIYDASATTTTGITYSLNASSLSGGNTIDAATGEVTFVAGYSGTTIITVRAEGCNGPRTATHTVTVTATVGTPVFALGATSTRCQLAGTVTYTTSATTSTSRTYSLDAASLDAGNTINSSTGAVTYVNTWSGTSTITVVAAGCNGPSTAFHTVTITPVVGTVSFTMGTTSERCQGAGTVMYDAAAINTTGITYRLDATTDAYAGNSINTTTGVVTYAAGWYGTSTITATAAGCTPKSSIHTVTTIRTVGTPVFTLGSTSSRCQAAGTVTYIATATTNTGITYQLDAASLSAGNSIDVNTGEVTYDAAWYGTSVITATATGCNGPKSANHTVTINAPVTSPVFNLGAASSRCQQQADVFYIATAGNTLANITYSLDAASRAAGNSIRSGTGEVNFRSDWTGTSIITASAPGCYGPQTSTHTVTTIPYVGAPTFALGSSSSRCQGAGNVIYTATATNTTGITYSLNSASITAGNSINATTGEVTYVGTYSGTTIITASAAGCSGPATRTHTVTVRATVGPTAFNAGASSTRCQGAGTVTYTASATTTTGITYSLDNNSLLQGNQINASNGAVTYSAGFSGTSVITATAAGCNGPTTANHTVTITPTVGEPVFAMGSSSSRCRAAGTVSYSATATNTSGITYSLDLNSRNAGNIINAATGVVTFTAAYSGTSTITASAAGCNGPDLSTHVVVTIPPVTTPVFSSGSSSTRCQGAAAVNYTATASNTTGITYSLDATSTAAGNAINASSGLVTYTASYTGTSVITATATGCFGPLSSNHTVTTTATVSTPAFTQGSSSTRCNGSATITYTATAATAITYSLDAASILGGNTINSATGAVNYATGWVGNTIITARAAGCGTPATTHTATSTPTVGTPVFSVGSSSSRCQGAGSQTYAASSGNSTGISYSLDAASSAAGNTINTSTGAVTYIAGWYGNSIITAISTGCNGPATSSHSAFTNDNGTPTFVLGSSSTRLQAAGNVTYTATAGNGATVTYSLDAASLSGGNTINSSTGIVAYSALWSGTTIITASSTGCYGSVAATHTVTVNPSSVIKQLYLSDPAQSLDRMDPVETNDLTTANSAIIANGGTTTFTQAPALCTPLTIKTGRNIVITNFVTVNSGSMIANPKITAVLKYGSTNIISLTTPTYNSAAGLLTWTGMVPEDVTVPAGQAIALSITSVQTGVTFTINYDSKTKPSKIDMPVSTFIDITSLDVYNAAYPGGTSINGAVTGTRNYIRAVVSDPFGFNDITGLDLTITPTGTTVTATSVATIGCTRIYEYVWNTPSIAGYLEITGKAKEGYENTVFASKTIYFSNCTNCPPRAYDDSASGAGGAPIIIDVLANDTDPNNNINPSSLSIVSNPQNGSVFISNGKVVYLPNGTYSGTDNFTYRICDFTAPTPLCATASVKVDIDRTIVDPCGETAQSHVYYIPFPEQDARTALINSTHSNYLPIPSSNIRTIISIKVPYPGMVIRWDHWEDGYEENILNPVQSTTRVWGDGNPYNGIAPGYPNDIIPAGGSIVFDNTMNANPRNASNIYYDGKDKVQSTGDIAITQVLGEPSIIGLQSMKTNVTSTTDFGQSFTIPVGQNFNSQDFRYTALFIRATENNTLVSIDKDNNGTFETTATLNEGQSLLVNGGVMTGATITGSAPIGVDLHFGGVDGYSSREVPIYPATWYSNVYYTPVPTTKSSNPAVVMFYNSLSRPITIKWTSGVPATGTFAIPAKTAIRYQLALSATNTYKFENVTGESFTAIEIVDSYAPGGGTSGPDFDWSFNLIAEDRLTTFATIAWAPGSTNGTRNDNPIWVTPAKTSRVYVKYNGDILSGGSLSPCGFRYDRYYDISALRYQRILDSDNDQSGIAIYTCDGTKIAAVYGEDPATALDANPSWDVGTTIKPYCASKLIFANDDYAYTLTDRSVTIPVLANDAGFTAVIDPSTLSVASGMQPKHGRVIVNANGTLLYTPNPGYIGLDTLEYTVCSTPTPVCDVALVIIKINGCPTPSNQNIVSGQVFLDKNKDGIRNDGGAGFAPAKVYLYADGNCNGAIDANELKDSVVVDSSGSYQFITYPERTIADDFDGTSGTSTCATGSDGNTAWKSNWVDAGDLYVGLCTSSSGNAEVIKDGSFGYALRLMNKNVSATRTVNISGASAAFLSFAYRRATTSLVTGRDVIVQASVNGSTFYTIYTISGDGKTDAGYVEVLNLDILPFAGSATTTYIRFLTNNNVGTTDIVYIDNINITYLKYPICYITALDAATVPVDYYVSTASTNSMTATNGGSCLLPFDFGMAKKIITISGTLYNDVNGLTDNIVNGIGTGAPSGNTVYAYLIDAAGKVEFKTTVNSLTGAYSFTKAEVNTNYTVVLSTIDVVVGAASPATANLPEGWVNVGDAYGTANRAGTGNQAGTPDAAIPVNSGLFNVTGVNFGIELRPTAGKGSNTAINPGGTISVTVPANTFSNLQVGSDPAPGIISSIRIASFPANITTITINNITYSSTTFPAAGVIVPANSTGQPTQVIKVDPLGSAVKVNIPFFVIDNANVVSSLPGLATIQFLIDTDKDGIADINDIDDDNDGIIDWIEVCGNGATGFSCAPGGIDPAQDNDGDGIVNWQDADYAPLNDKGCTASLDSDGDGVPDFLDLDSDNDGIPDVVEAYGVDVDGNGVIDNFTDPDGDGLSQNVDKSNNGPANSGNGLGFIDLDGDGIPNSLDLDSDGDGLPDIIEVLGTDANNDGRLDVFVDTDEDGLADSVDSDADNNGTIENSNGPLLKTGPSTNNDGWAGSYPYKNADRTGKPNAYDLDSDGDGIIDAVEAGYTISIGISNGQVSGGKTNGWANSIQSLATLTPRNTDGRGPADYLDIDSDDDGITDNIEAQSTFTYKTSKDADQDGDGIADVFEFNSGTYGGNGLTPFDKDGDGTPDYIDSDTDNDGAPDINEGSHIFTLTQGNVNANDADGDGYLDEFDIMNIATLTAGNMWLNMSNNNFGDNGSFNGPLPGGSNVKITKSKGGATDDRDWRSIVILPLQIVGFNGTFQNNIVSLKWNVKNENEVNYYEIERSPNGTEFTKIATVNAFNVDNSNYQYKDDISTVSLVNVYYRVRQVSKNGQSYYTNVLKWRIENTSEQPVLYPNPVQDDLKIKYVSPDNQTADIAIMDAAGKTVLTTSFNMIRGQNILTIPRVGSLHKGSYLLRMNSGLDVWVMKFIVQ